MYKPWSWQKMINRELNKELHLSSNLLILLSVRSNLLTTKSKKFHFFIFLQCEKVIFKYIEQIAMWF